MRRGMRKPRGLRVRRYVDLFIDLNEYLDSFFGFKLSDKIVVNELKIFLLNIMTNKWSKQAYVQGIDCEYISF